MRQPAASAYFAGMQQDYDEFSRELDQITSYVSKHAEEKELVPA